MIGFDTETALIGPGATTPPLVCATFAGRDITDAPPVADIFRPGKIWTALLTDPALIAEYLIDRAAAGRSFVAHNAAFDVAVLAEHATGWDHWLRLLDAGDVLCTQRTEELIALREARFEFDRGKPAKFDLATLVLRYFDVDISGTKTEPDAWRLRYAELLGTPAVEWPAAAVDYAIEDAVWALRVSEVQAREPDAAAKLRAAVALNELTRQGIAVDGKRAAAWAESERAALDLATKIGQRAGFIRANGTKDTKQIQARITDAWRGTYAGEDPPLTPAGRVSMSRDTVRRCGDPQLRQWSEAAGAHAKNLQTYAPVILPGEIVHPRYRPCLATGRTSCWGPNLQNPPRSGGFRECFVPRAPGYVLCSIDYNTAELQALAQVCLWWFGHSALADAINAGRDPHVMLAATLGGWTYEHTADAIKNEQHPDHARAKMLRQFAKIANFGFPGGLGSDTLVDYARGYGITITPEHAAELKEAWFTTWPELRDYFDKLSTDSIDRRIVVEHPISERTVADRSFCQAANAYFQGLVADFATDALYCVVAETLSPSGWLRGARVVLFVHDEIILELPEENATALADRAAEIMHACERRFMPDLKGGCEPALMRRWYKDAKTIRAADGTLIPWAPTGAEEIEPEAPEDPDEDEA